MPVALAVPRLIQDIGMLGEIGPNPLRRQVEQRRTSEEEAISRELSEAAFVIAEGRPFTEGPSERVAAMPEIRQAYLGL